LTTGLETCIPWDNDHVCHVIDGSTTILLDTGATNAKNLAYDAIKAALANEEFLTDYAPAVATASFLEIGRDSFVVSPPSSRTDSSTEIQSTTITIIIAASSVSFVVASIFAYGIFRRHPMGHLKGLSSPNGKASPGHIGIKPGSYYDLDAEQPSLFHLDINDDSPSNTWSVSDITSEGSIRSGLSRATSTLEKIDEETLDEIEMFEDEELDEDSDLPFQRSPESVSHFIADFDAVGYQYTSQDNGHMDAMESMELSREEYSEDEAEYTMVPVTMSIEEAQSMLDDFLLPFSHSPDDVEFLANAEDHPQETSTIITDDAAESGEEEEETSAGEETTELGSTTNAYLGGKGEFEEQRVGVEEEMPIILSTEDVAEAGEEESQETPAAVEKTEDHDATTCNLNGEDEVEEQSGGVVAHDDDSEDLDCSPTPSEDLVAASRTATAVNGKLESKVEDIDTPSVPRQEFTASCDGTKSAKESEAKDDDATAEASEAPCEELVDDEASTATATSKEEATVVSPVSSINVKENVASETEGTPVEASATNIADHAATTPQVCEAVSDKHNATTEKTDGAQNAIERVVSLDEPIGLAVGDISLDDSLALSTDTTESDEEVSLSGWLTKFLYEMSGDKGCATKCESPCQSEEQSAEK